MTRRLFLKRTSLAALSGLLTPQLARPGTISRSPADDSRAFMSATDLAAAIAARKVSSAEVVESLLRRIGEHNGELKAIVEVFADEAREEAKRADEELAKGRSRGPLHGVPITIKDMFSISGKVLAWGAFKNNVQESDSLPVARLREAGAILIGRTNTPVLADDWQTFNELYGVTRNPWDLERTPGGSSGGCSAAVAAGLSYLSLGGDIGGSIRVPAHFCGVYGHRPSRGIVPVSNASPSARKTPPIPEWETFVAGPLARSAEDLKTALRVLGGFAHPKSVALRWNLPNPRRTELKQYRVGYVIDDSFCPLMPEVRAVYEDAVKTLRSEGVSLREGWPDGFDLKRNYLTWTYLTFSGLMKGPGYEQYAHGQRPAGEETYFEAAKSAATGSFYEYKKKHHERLIIQEVWRNYFKTHDAFLLPPSFVPAFRHGPSLRQENVLQTSLGPRTYGHLNVWPSVSGLSGNPSTTFPVGLTATGLPVGLEILGPTLEDATPLDLAERLSSVFGGFQPPPV